MHNITDHELLHKIGQGSYGEVWLARNVMGTLRAVKIVYRASFDSERPYEREFGGLQKFEPVSRTHPGLITILLIGRNQECFYCVMEVADDAAQVSESVSEKPDLAVSLTQPSSATAIPHSYIPRTLAYELAKRGRLPLAECLHLGITLSEALAHLHGHGLV